MNLCVANNDKYYATINIKITSKLFSPMKREMLS